MAETKEVASPVACIATPCSSATLSAALGVDSGEVESLAI